MITERKITTQDINNNNVKSVVGNKLAGTVEQNKNVFDKLVELFTGKYNSAIDDLTSTNEGTSGADNIGSTILKVGGSTTVGGQLGELYNETVKTTGSQSIDGKKTFVVVPAIPSPSVSTDATNKGYVDTSIAAVVLGQIPDNSLTDAKLGTDIKIGSLASLATTIKTSIVNAINELVTSLSTLSGTVSGHTTSISTLTNDKADKDTNIILVTTNKTLALTDKATYQNVTSASNLTITIPKDIFPIKSEVVIARNGTGTVTIAGSTDVTLHSDGEKRTIKSYGAVTVKQVATNDWRLYGALE